MTYQKALEAYINATNTHDFNEVKKFCILRRCTGLQIKHVRLWRTSETTSNTRGKSLKRKFTLRQMFTG